MEEREFYEIMRRALLAIVAAIEKRYPKQEGPPPFIGK